jgi:hypothetical protein
MPSAPAGAAEAATGRDLDGQRRGGGTALPPQTAEEAVATARAYAESISDGVIERDRAGRAPAAELARLDASGLLAITVPRSLGGPELGAPALAEVIRTIAAVDPAIAQVPQGHFLFCDVLAARPRWSSGAAATRPSTAVSPLSEAAPRRGDFLLLSVLGRGGDRGRAGRGVAGRGVALAVWATGADLLAVWTTPPMGVSGCGL